MFFASIKRTANLRYSLEDLERHALQLAPIGLALLVALYANNLKAGAIGQPSLPEKAETLHSEASQPPTTKPTLFSQLQVGLGTNVDYVNINDEQGQTANRASIQAKSLFFINPFLYDTRYLAEFFISSHVLTAKKSGIGEKSNNKGLRFTVQFKIHEGRYFSPWYGIGTGLSRGEYTKRHKTDNEGWLIEEFDDLSKLSLNLLFNVMQTWPISSNLNIGAKIEYKQPLTQAINGFSGSLLFLYQPNF